MDSEDSTFSDEKNEKNIRDYVLEKKNIVKDIREKEVYNMLSEMHNNAPPSIKTDEIYTNIKKFAKSTPDIWEEVFKSIAKLPQYLVKVYNYLVFRVMTIFSWSISWLIVAILEDAEFIQNNNIKSLWNNINLLHNNNVPINMILNDTQIYNTFDISKFVNDYVYFVFLIRNVPKDKRLLIINDTKSTLELTNDIIKNKVHTLWNSLRKDELKNTEIHNYFIKNKCSFKDLYEYIKNPEKIKDQ